MGNERARSLGALSVFRGHTNPMGWVQSRNMGLFFGFQAIAWYTFGRDPANFWWSFFFGLVIIFT